MHHLDVSNRYMLCGNVKAFLDLTVLKMCKSFLGITRHFMSGMIQTLQNTLVLALANTSALPEPR